MKKTILLSIVTAFLLLTSCNDDSRTMPSDNNSELTPTSSEETASSDITHEPASTTSAGSTARYIIGIC